MHIGFYVEQWLCFVAIFRSCLIHWVTSCLINWSSWAKYSVCMRLCACVQIYIHQSHDILLLSARAAATCYKLCLRHRAYKPAEDFQKLCDSVEVLSFIYEPEDQTTYTHT